MPPKVQNIHVCTNGVCRRDGSRATLVELEELASIVDGRGRVVEYNCFGLCGRGPNVNIEYADGRTEMRSGVKTLEQSLAVIEQAYGVRPQASDAAAARLLEHRRVSQWEEQLAKAQGIIEVLDVSSSAKRASADGQRQYDAALAHVDQVLAEVAAGSHPRRLAEAIRRQVLAARSGRPPSPEVEDVQADDPDTWPEGDAPPPRAA